MGLSSISTSHSPHCGKKSNMMDLISDELVLKGHTSEVYDCAWNPSPILVSMSEKNLNFWHISDEIGESRPQYGPVKVTEPLRKRQRQYVSAVEWNYDGTLLAIVSHDDGRARIWSTSGELRSTLTLSGEMEKISTLKWNKNNNYLFTGGYKGPGIVWDVDTSKVKQEFRINVDADCRVIDADWRDDDSLATICAGEFEICIYKIGEAYPDAILPSEDDVKCVKWDPTGVLLASCAEEDCTIKIWRLWDDEYIRNLEEHKKVVNLIRWSPMGTNQPSILASGSADATVKLWDVEQGKSLYTLHEHWDSIGTLAFSPNGEYLASGAEDEIHIWSVKEGKLIKSYLSETAGVSNVCWNKEGDKIAASFDDCSVRVLNFRK